MVKQISLFMIHERFDHINFENFEAKVKAYESAIQKTIFLAINSMLRNCKNFSKNQVDPKKESN